MSCWQGHVWCGTTSGRGYCSDECRAQGGAASRSVQRRLALQRGEPMPVFVCAVCGPSHADTRITVLSCSACGYVKPQAPPDNSREIRDVLDDIIYSVPGLNDARELREAILSDPRLSVALRR